jgi:hypothetical protein
LSDGLYHDIYNLISVILGQADIIRSEIRSDNENETEFKLSKSINKLSTAADDITGFINILKDLSVVFDNNRQIPIDSFLNNLVYMTRGYTKKIIEDKNIYMKYEIESTPSVVFNLYQQEIYDIILPVIVSIYDSATRSVILNFSTNISSERNHLKIAFSNENVDFQRFTKSISKLFHDKKMKISKDNNRQIILDSMIITLGEKYDECLIDFSKASEIFIKDRINNEIINSMGQK